MAATVDSYRMRNFVAVLAAAALGSGCVTSSVTSEGAATEQAVAAPAPPASSPAPPSAPDFTAADLSNGARVYQSLCAFCHGDNGRGGTGGGTSLRIAATAQEIANIVNGGRNMMPSMSANLSDEEIRDVAVYVVDRFGIEDQ